MKHKTIGYRNGKTAYIECVKNDSLKNIDIKDKSFLFLVVTGGTASFSAGNETVTAKAPCFICFNETENPKLIKKRNLNCFALYFRPDFLNMHLSFDVLKKQEYEGLLHAHDLYMLAPFTDGPSVVAVSANDAMIAETACEKIKNQLETQPDFFWSCRSRSYFMELMIMLERKFCYFEESENENLQSADRQNESRVKCATDYIESHFSEKITLKKLVCVSGVNHTTLNRIMKEHTGKTCFEYITFYRIEMAKKHMSFTNLPIKEVTNLCGFKTTQHFSRVFKQYTNYTPADFRHITREKRDSDFAAVE